MKEKKRKRRLQHPVKPRQQLPPPRLVQVVRRLVAQLKPQEGPLLEEAKAPQVAHLDGALLEATYHRAKVVVRVSSATKLLSKAMSFSEMAASCIQVLRSWQKEETSSWVTTTLWRSMRGLSTGSRKTPKVTRFRAK